MGEYLSLPWQKVIPATDISPRDCALIEPMSVGFHAVSRGQVTDIDTVLVIGCGMIGCGAIVRAALRGATVEPRISSSFCTKYLVWKVTSLLA